MNQERFQQLLDEFSSKRVTILGDFILDEYLLGDTKRVSREAPVIVIDYRESLFLPGGGANAAQNMSVLGGAARVFGIIGTDKEGDKLCEILQGKGVDTSGLKRDPAATTAVKTRILAGDLHAQKQQVARIDRSGTIPRGCAALESLSGETARMIDETDAVLISDYGMGVVPGTLSEQVIAGCRSKGVPVVVDSRFNVLGFPGASVATPNEVELFDALEVKRDDRRDIQGLASSVIAEGKIDGLIVTRGSQGMEVCTPDVPSATIGIVGSSDATDVTGAGDTVAAAVTLALACGASLVEAAEVATYAAAFVVMKRGTATVEREDMTRLREKYPSPRKGGSS